jgi:hypothetical protein
MHSRIRHHRRQTTPCGERLIGVDVTVADEDLALLQSLGNGDASAGLMRMVRAVEALPEDVLARLVDEARAAGADHAEDHGTDDPDMVH